MGEKSYDNPVFVGDVDSVSKTKPGVAPIEMTKQEKKSCDVKEQPVAFLHLFRFASRFDIFLIVVSVICAAISGICFPITIIFFGELTDAFINNDYTDAEVIAMRCNGTNITVSTNLMVVTASNETITQAYTDYAVRCGVTGLLCIVLTFIYVSCLNIAAENQVFRLRSEFMKAVLKQDISWYDTHTSNDFASRITENMNRIHEGVGEKIGIALTFVTTGMACVIIAFCYGWKLTLVTIVSIPIISASTAIVGKIQARFTLQELAIYASSGGMAEEIISAIRTVVVFGGQDKEYQRFQDVLRPARQAGIKRGLVSAIGIAIYWLVCYSSYALAFWYGMKLILDNCNGYNGYNAENINVVFFCVLYGTFKIGQSVPFMEAFATARGAAASVYQIIDRVPQIDSSSPSGVIPDQIQGHVRFNRVHFQYPSRPDVTILDGIDFQVKAGQTVALVGLSGCGKSTCIQLLQRFYDPCNGQIELDGRRLSDLNIKWLRSQIGVVGQEPVLFATTIAANIRYGQDGLSDSDVERAAKEANAHDFISQLPLRYETMVGERGAQLSGGQKQRIAIARALAGNPKILLFDEATSALDTQSEVVVQRALDRARLGRTTIVVAHRLTTVQNADVILALDKGSIKEVGSHETLMAKCGLYYQLVISQKRDDDKEEEKNAAEDSAPRDNDAVSVEKGRSIEDQFKIETHQHASENDITEQSATETDETGVSFRTIMNYNRPEWIYIALGSFGSLIMGLSTPLYAIIFGQTMDILSELDPDVFRQKRDANALMYFLLAIGTAVGAFLQSYMFTIAGENLTSRLRAVTFKSILSQEMGFFDREENNVGSLCTRLSSDASNIQGATGPRIGLLIQIAVTLLVSLGSSIYFSWKLGLVLSTMVPIVLGAGALETKLGDGQNVKKSKSLEKAGSIAMESISNIRTVASLGREEMFHSLYMDCLLESYLQARKSSPIRALAYGAAINASILTSILSICYGGYLNVNENLSIGAIYTVNESLVFGMEMVGQMCAFTPNYGKAKVAARRLFQIINRIPRMESGLSAGGQHLDDVSGKVQMDDLHFSYPTRKDVPILRGFNVVIKPGQTVALVGQSGCGKSTCIQLLERFYDADSGTICIDDRDVQPLQTASFRSNLGIVSQEPVLFNRSIGENIAYGDLRRSVSMDEIIAASKKANIHNFISSLPLGYDTMVGQKGTQLSGGQKQRVAIARALLRNPKILLLDEATSALDSESEMVVQEALDNASQGRTCITIAHRLSTIQNADHIFVVHRGRVHEYGKHEELLQLRGIYHHLWTVQVGKQSAKSE